MADERKCYAGDLTSDAIGKTIRFEDGDPNRRTTYTDVLMAVEHKQESLRGTLYPEKFKTVTVLHLKGTHWTRGTGMFGLPSPTDVGLTVDDTLLVEVL